MTLRDGAAWDETEGDSLNPSSYTATELFTTVTMAIGVLDRSEFPVTPRSVQAMSGTLLHIIDTAQQDLVGEVNRQAFSHARLREALASALATIAYPPLYSRPDSMDAWVGRVIKRVNSIARTAHTLWADGPGVRPWAALAAVKPDTGATETAAVTTGQRPDSN